MLLALTVSLPDVSKVLDEAEYSGSTYVHTRLKVANASIPLIVFLGFKEGLEKILDMYDVEYEFTKERTPTKVQYTESIRFANGYMHFRPNSVQKNLLVNGIFQLPTSDYDFEQFGKDGEGYYQYFLDDVTPRYGKALANFYTLFIDPITTFWRQL